jgi:hypothetical protein
MPIDMTKRWLLCAMSPDTPVGAAAVAQPELHLPQRQRHALHHQYRRRRNSNSGSAIATGSCRGNVAQREGDGLYSPSSSISTRP